jgi:sensor histidine kinase regulating citrate/malate metabolism
LADDKAYNCEFDTSSLGVIFDNVATNSIKAGATKIDITIEDKHNFVEIAFSDNGIGLSGDVDVDMLFEWGISANAKNKGFGIGLYHIKMLVTDMHGNVYIDTAYKDGFRLVVALKK